LKIVLVHNRYAIPGRGSGEEVALDAISGLLKEKGHTVLPYFRSSLEVTDMRFGNLRAFFTGVYNASAKKEMLKLLERERPDLVLVQNLYPLLSPSVLLACQKVNVPVIMRCPNYRLICPGGLFMRNGNACELCAGGKEYWCILKNCESDIFKSIGYALRGFVARRFSLFTDNVDVFMVLTEFAKRKLIQNGFPGDRITVISGLANPDRIKPLKNPENSSYVGFAGRVSPEKGMDMLLGAAGKLPDVPFKVAGNNDRHPNLLKQAPANVKFIGHLNHENLKAFYAGAKMIVLPNQWYEGLPMGIVEAMLYEKPVISSDLGGLPEIVQHGSTGFLFRHGDVEDFGDKIQTLWNDPNLCRRMGMTARKKAEKQYGPDAFYERFMNSYEIARSVRNHRHVSGNLILAPETMEKQACENIAGYPVTTESTEACVERVLSWIGSEQRRKYFVCANPHSLELARSDHLFRKAIINADLLTPDGIGIVLASKIHGGCIRDRVTGSDIFLGLSDALNRKRGYSYFFLGSSEKTLDKIRERIRFEFPNIEVAGTFSPPFRTAFTSEENGEMVEVVNKARPHVLWVGMTAPKQEKWIYQHRNQLDVRFIGPVGAVFDFYAGTKKRSGKWFVDHGFEWLPRLLREPQSVWSRNFISFPIFVFRNVLSRLLRGN